MDYVRMRRRLLANKFWYFSFIGIGAGILLYTIYKEKKVWNLLAFFMASVTMAFIGELIVLFMFEGYMYKPDIYVDPFANNVIGHVIPNAALWGTTAVLVGSLKFRYRRIIVIAGMYMCVEVLFLKLGLYEHRWWKLYMTGIACIIYYTIVKYAYAALEKGNLILRNMMFVLLGVVVMHTPSIVFLLMDMQFFQVGWVENTYRESILFGVIYHTVFSLVVVLSARFLKLPYRITAPFLLLAISDSILAKHNIMILEKGMNVLWVSVASGLSIVIIIMFERYTWQPKHK